MRLVSNRASRRGCCRVAFHEYRTLSDNPRYVEGVQSPLGHLLESFAVSPFARLLAALRALVGHKWVITAALCANSLLISQAQGQMLGATPTAPA